MKLKLKLTTELSSDPYMQFIYGDNANTNLERWKQHIEEQEAIEALARERELADDESFSGEEDEASSDDPLNQLLAREEAGDDVFH